jgi:hypothetical protein
MAQMSEPKTPLYAEDFYEFMRRHEALELSVTEDKVRALEAVNTAQAVRTKTWLRAITIGGTIIASIISLGMTILGYVARERIRAQDELIVLVAALQKTQAAENSTVAAVLNAHTAELRRRVDRDDEMSRAILDLAKRR